MTDPISLSTLAAWPHPVTGDLMPGLAAIVAWLISHVTAAALAVVSYRPPLWARVTIPLGLTALTIWWVRYVNRPAKLGRRPSRRFLRSVDERRDGER